jgi:hypothetical protein
VRSDVPAGFLGHSREDSEFPFAGAQTQGERCGRMAQHLDIAGGTSGRALLKKLQPRHRACCSYCSSLTYVINNQLSNCVAGCR